MDRTPMSPELIFSLTQDIGRGSESYAVPASHAAVDDFEDFTRFSLPTLLRQIYLTHDGEVFEPEAYLSGLFHGFPLMSLGKARTVIEGFQSVCDDELLCDAASFVSRPPGRVQARYFSRGWVPFAGGFSPDYLAVDFDPGPSGMRGQVILIAADCPDRICLADSFDAFAEDLVACYRAKTLHLAFGWGMENLEDLSIHSPMRRAVRL